MRIEAYFPNLAQRLHQLASAAIPRETCGIITADGQLVELPNLAGDPAEHFDIGSLDDLEAAQGPVNAIWHTHPSDEPPSAPDLAGCRATALPWVIAGPTRLWGIHPRPLGLVGRDFVYGIEDCWQEVSDWFAWDRGILLPWFSRPADGWWNESGPSPYLEAAASYGFTVRPLEDVGIHALKPGDVLLMKIAGLRVNHAALYIGGGTILHHLYGCLSTAEQFDERYQRHTHFVGRHNLLT